MPAFAPDADDGFERSSFARLADVEAANFWFRSRNRLIVWAIGRYFPTASSMFEIGCGTGFVLSGIRAARPEISLSGSDIFVEGLAFARQRVPDATLFQMDARSIPFAGEYDIIGAFDVLEHIDDDDAALDEIHRACKAGGGVVLTVPAHPWLWSASDVYAHHKRRYRRGELEAKLRRAGFDVIRSTGFTLVLLPLLAGLRRTQRDVATFDPMSGLQLNRAINAGLESMLAIERAWLRAGVSLPMGSSRLVVARKRNQP
jgi:SAM-dependent methyltransferase